MELQGQPLRWSLTFAHASYFIEMYLSIIIPASLTSVSFGPADHSPSVEFDLAGINRFQQIEGR